MAVIPVQASAVGFILVEEIDLLSAGAKDVWMFTQITIQSTSTRFLSADDEKRKMRANARSSGPQSNLPFDPIPDEARRCAQG